MAAVFTYIAAGLAFLDGGLQDSAISEATDPMRVYDGLAIATLILPLCTLLLAVFSTIMDVHVNTKVGKTKAQIRQFLENSVTAVLQKLECSILTREDLLKDGLAALDRAGRQPIHNRCRYLRLTDLSKADFSFFAFHNGWAYFTKIICYQKSNPIFSRMGARAFGDRPQAAQLPRPTVSHA